MPRRSRKQPLEEPASTGPAGLPEPLHSLDPVEWNMYCDLLQDAGEPEEKWARARRIAESLENEPRLVLINYCAAGSLENHFLRVGRTWFIGADLTSITSYNNVWWRSDWVRDGFERYPTTQSHRDVEKLLALNLGTPWFLPHPHFKNLLKSEGHANLVAAFFTAHGLHEIPSEYL